MVSGSFGVGQRLQMGGAEYRINRVLEDNVVVLEDLVTGRFSENTLSELLQSWSHGALVLGGRNQRPVKTALAKAIDGAHEDAFRQSYSKDQQDHARAKLVYIRRLEVLPRTEAIMTPVIVAIWKDKNLWNGTIAFQRPPHFTTVAGWIRTYTDAGRDIRSLVNRHFDKGAREDRLDPLVEVMIADLIQTRYLTLERPSIQILRKEIKGLIALENTRRIDAERLGVPSYNTLKRRIGKIDPYERYLARYGKLAADMKFRAAGRGVIVVRPLERASMDHTRLDLFVIDERTGLPLGRPWLTVIIDEFSRYILGYYLSFEEPSSVSMARALKHALEPKEKSSDTKCHWGAWGIMEMLVVDNGLEFHGKALESGAGRFGICVQFCPRRKPWFKGKVERIFGTLGAGLLVDIKGKTFSSILLKGDYDPAKHAVLTLATLREIVNIWIVDIYHQEPHRALGMSPAQAWDQGITSTERYLPPASIAVESAFSSSIMRRLTHKGIEFDLLLYNSPALRVVREQYGSEIEVEIRTQDDDLGSIVVVSPDGVTLLAIPAIEIEYAKGLTRWQHRVCKRYQRRLREDDEREIGLLEARNRIRALIQQDMNLRNKKTRKKQQRFLENEGEQRRYPLLPVASVAAEASAAPAFELESQVRPRTDNSCFNADEEDCIPAFSSRKRTDGHLDE